MKGDICACGRENKRGGDTCSACYQRGYYARGGKAAIVAANKRYEASHPEKRPEWVRRYRERVGIIVPELDELRAANKDLEQALVHSSQRQAAGLPGGSASDGRAQR